jgi:hypothetical protein
VPIPKERKITNPSEQLIKINSLTVPSWQADLIDELGEKWRSMIKPEQLTGADLLRTIIGLGLVEVGKVVGKANREELISLLGKLRSKGGAKGLETVPGAQEKEIRDDQQS